jgi:hypothetical protein
MQPYRFLLQDFKRSIAHIAFDCAPQVELA